MSPYMYIVLIYIFSFLCSNWIGFYMSTIFSNVFVSNFEPWNFANSKVVLALIHRCFHCGDGRAAFKSAASKNLNTKIRSHHFLGKWWESNNFHEGWGLILILLWLFMYWTSDAWLSCIKLLHYKLFEVVSHLHCFDHNTSVYPSVLQHSTVGIYF